MQARLLPAKGRSVKWTSLADQKPPVGVVVLRYPGDMRVVSVDVWVNGYDCFLMDIDGQATATHWMPLPDLPGER